MRENICTLHFFLALTWQKFTCCCTEKRNTSLFAQEYFLLDCTQYFNTMITTYYPIELFSIIQYALPHVLTALKVNGYN